MRGRGDDGWGPIIKGIVNLFWGEDEFHKGCWRVTTVGAPYHAFGTPPPPRPVSNEQFCPQKIRSERECSSDRLFSARDNIAKHR